MPESRTMHRGPRSWVAALRQGFQVLVHKLFLSVTYDSDFRRELARIERIASKIDDRGDHQAEPIRYLWRSVAQYRCQSYARGRLALVAANLMSLLAIPVVLAKYCKFKQPVAKPSRKIKYLKINFHMAYVIPNSIKNDTEESNNSSRYFYFNDFLFVFNLFVYQKAFYPELLVKFLMWLASVRPHLDIYQPEFLIQYCEFSSHSSLRKAFLNHRGIRMANITHGEEAISCRNAFSSFDQYFAWYITPSEIHQRMHMEYNELFHFNPCENLPVVPDHLNTGTIGVLWPSIPSQLTEIFVEQVNYLNSKYSVIIRPHPNSNYSASIEAYRSQLLADIRPPKDEDLHKFIDQCSIVVGFSSAVLLQVVFRNGRVLYLENEALDNIKIYHEFYRNVPSIKVDGLADFFGCSNSSGSKARFLKDGV